MNYFFNPPTTWFFVNFFFVIFEYFSTTECFVIVSAMLIVVSGLSNWPTYSHQNSLNCSHILCSPPCSLDYFSFHENARPYATQSSFNCGQRSFNLIFFSRNPKQKNNNTQKEIFYIVYNIVMSIPQMLLDWWK